MQLFGRSDEVRPWSIRDSEVVDGVAALDLESDRLPGQGLDEDLHLGRLNTSRSLASLLDGRGLGFWVVLVVVDRFLSPYI
jgi:hypothetical protein